MKKLIFIMVFVCIVLFCSMPIFANPWPEPGTSSCQLTCWVNIEEVDYGVKP